MDKDFSGEPEPHGLQDLDALTAEEMAADVGSDEWGPAPRCTACGAMLRLGEDTRPWNRGAYDDRIIWFLGTAGANGREASLTGHAAAGFSW